MRILYEYENMIAIERTQNNEIVFHVTKGVLTLSAAIPALIISKVCSVITRELHEHPELLKQVFAPRPPDRLAAIHKKYKSTYTAEEVNELLNEVINDNKDIYRATAQLKKLLRLRG